MPSNGVASGSPSTSLTRSVAMSVNIFDPATNRVNTWCVWPDYIVETQINILISLFMSKTKLTLGSFWGSFGGFMVWGCCYDSAHTFIKITVKNWFSFFWMFIKKIRKSQEIWDFQSHIFMESSQLKNCGLYQPPASLGLNTHLKYSWFNCHLWTWCCCGFSGFEVTEMVIILIALHITQQL